MEKIDSVKRKMFKSGLATLAVAGLIGASAITEPKKALAACESCETCESCPGKCTTCSTCSKCSNGGAGAQQLRT